MQVSAIDDLERTLKDEPSKLLIVLDHKQKILPMRYCEDQVDYYGKKEMNMLRAMKVKWDSETIAAGNPHNGFQYSFTDYVFKGYAGQDNVQVTGAFEQGASSEAVILHGERNHFPK